MENCNGNCGSCGGCSRELWLTAEELEILKELAQFAFLPVARHSWEETPHDPEQDTRQRSVLLQLLEKKSLISLDYDLPLKGCDYGPYNLRGSMALTQRGQQTLELVEYQGISE